MTEIFSPHVESLNFPEVIGPAELEEVLQRARAPIIKEGFTEPWVEDSAAFDPAQAGWEQAAQNLLGQIDRMRSSGLVQLTPEGLTPKQAAGKSGESAKLAAANARAAELAEQFEQAKRAAPSPFAPVEAPESSPREQWDQLPDEAEEPAAESEEEEVEAKTKKGLARFLENFDWKTAAKEGAFAIGPAIFGGALYAAFPELQTALIQLASSGAVAGLLSEGAIQALSRADLVHPRLAGLARTIAAGRGWGARLAEVSVSALGGMAVVGAIEYLTQLHAVQPPGPGAGDTSWPPRPIIEGTEGRVSPVEPAGPQHQRVGGLPGGEPAAIPPEEFLPQPGDAELLTQHAAEVARIAALQQGPTVAELAAQMPKHTISEAIYQMIGKIPHAGEITNVIFRAAGDDTGQLHEGAIKALADALSKIFTQADVAAAGMGVPYDAGGLGAAEQVLGPNSPAVNAIKAGNLANLEAAANIRDAIFRPILSGLAIK